MKERIKLIRKTLAINQSDMAEKINLARATIASYENGNSLPSDRTIKDISKAFNINEQWLRTGEGPMFREQDNLDNMLTADVAKLVRSSDDFTKKLIHNYLSLPQEARDKVKKFILKLAEAENKEN